MSFALAGNSDPEGLVDLQMCGEVRNKRMELYNQQRCWFNERDLVKVQQPDGV